MDYSDILVNSSLTFSILKIHKGLPCWSWKWKQFGKYCLNWSSRTSSQSSIELTFSYLRHSRCDLKVWKAFSASNFAWIKKRTKHYLDEKIILSISFNILDWAILSINSASASYCFWFKFLIKGVSIIIININTQCSNHKTNALLTTSPNYSSMTPTTPSQPHKTTKLAETSTPSLPSPLSSLCWLCRRSARSSKPHSHPKTVDPKRDPLNNQK